MPHSPPSPTPDLHYKTTSSINPLPLEVRESILRETPTRAVHDLIYERHIDLFDRIEIGPPSITFDDAPSPATITFWNVERGRYPDEQAALLRAQNASAHLLCELDLGMARTKQRHTTRDLADRLGCSYAFGVEFLELGLGDRREQGHHAGDVNQAGLHGAALLSPHPLRRSALVRLRRDGAWFDGERGEPRIGGRIAILATLSIDGRLMTLASVHLESHSDPEARAFETGVLLDAIDAYAPDQPVLIGGDFNTSTLDRIWSRGNGERPVLPGERVMNPIPYEPLFERLAERGYSWESANDMTAPTQRWYPNDNKTGLLGKIDWFVTRGLNVVEARTVPAVNAQGRVLSDHEMLTVIVA